MQRNDSRLSKDDHDGETVVMALKRSVEESKACAVGKINEVFDNYIEGDIQDSEKPQGIQEILARYDLPAKQISMIKDLWEKQIKELNASVTNKDKVLSEGYSWATKDQQKNMISYCKEIISELEAYSKDSKEGVKRRKPRPPEKVVRKLKLLSEFPELNLKTEDPTKILESSEMWVYNTKNRKLQYYVADAQNKVFMVKGTSILNFDAKKSTQKTLRKPEQFLPQLSLADKPSRRKLFDELKTTGTPVNGRFNDNLIIIKATYTLPSAS